ncbi:MAG: mannose-1-phosphate guanylyltransferase [Chlamydiae bacterium]|nr:mannose-1-phosphate guanylyltransferase [Chlamydiota bacterium]MBI3266009.1 mannose-1-phosphate guanylyltransferase [Chlamydiota bacterium]
MDKSKNLYAVIMAGGVGERFWPQSRQHIPKQFLKILGSRTLIQKTVERIAPLIPMERVWVVSNQKHESLIRSQLPKLKKNQILLEPFGKNTAPCIGLAVAFLNKIDPEGIMVVLPADHLIRDEKEFLKMLKAAADIADQEESLVTLGIKPEEPETGYGYIHFGKPIKKGANTPFFHVQKFVEKPTLQKAKAYLKDGHYLWNSGMFVWRVKTILKAFQEHLPQVYEPLEEFKKAIGTRGEKKAILKMYEAVPKVSIDYGVMEKAASILVGSGDFGWDDLGAWPGLERHLKKDNQGNVARGAFVSVDADNSIVLSQDGIVALLGVKNLVVVKTKDAVLVMGKDRAQDVKAVLEKMKGCAEYKKYL